MNIKEIERVVETCSVCPGICVSSCPVFLSSRVRFSSPVSIARATLRYIRFREGETKAPFYCVYCRACEEACPLNNKLAEALRSLRSALVTRNAERIPSPVYLAGRGPELLLVSPRKPSIAIVKKLAEDHSLYWLNSKDLAIDYVNGLVSAEEFKEIGQSFHLVISEDLDLPVTDFETVLRFMKRVIKLKPAVCKRYVLHIPCKVKPSTSIINDIEDLIKASPLKIIRGCSGALIERVSKRLSYLMLETFKSKVGGELPVITLCRRAQEFLSKNGVRSYTILDLLEVESC